MPGGLSSTLGDDRLVQLSWTGSTDANQPGGLTYNVWLRRADETNFLLSADADTNSGRLYVPRRGNANVSTRYIFSNLLAGRYFWTVQAVDNGFASSAFAAPAEFVIPAGLPRIEEFAIGDVRFQHATFTAEVIPNGAHTLAWFEFGLSTNFGSRTEPMPVGETHLAASFTNEVTALRTAERYYVRLTASNHVGIVYSQMATFFITNQPPDLQVNGRIQAVPNATTEPIPILITDLETAPELLKVSFAITPLKGNNTNLLVEENIHLRGNGTNRSVVFKALPDQFGSLNITFTVEDEHGGKRSRGVEYRVNVFNRAGIVDFAPGDEFAGADVDADGWLDWVGNRRWIHNGDGTNFAGAGSALSQMTAASPLAFGDPDNDGKVDFAAVGTQSREARSLIYTNRPASVLLTHIFRQIPNALDPGFLEAALSWQDYDLDGDVDLFAAGVTARRGADAVQRLIWRNDGGLNFSPVGLDPPLYEPAMAWTDFNRDGAPDLLLLGTTNRVDGYTRLFLNTGTGILEESAVALPQVRFGAVAWGDVDQDGRADLLLGGVQRGARGNTNVVLLLRQDEAGGLSEMARFESLRPTECFLADLDNDGLLDVIYHGISSSFPGDARTKIYLNRRNWTFHDASPGTVAGSEEIPRPLALGDFNGDGTLDVAANRLYFTGTAWRANDPPTRPQHLESAVEGESVLLRWSPGQDSAQTNGLTYNVRVGRTPGGAEVLSPMSLANGRRILADTGNAHHALQRRLRGLAAGQYFWSVQAIDASLASSPFASEQIFSIGGTGRLEITSIRFAGDQLELAFTGAFSTNLTVEQSFDLRNWLPVKSVAAHENRTVTVPLPLTGIGFFRLREN
jgi:hypothetical protein